MHIENNKIESEICGVSIPVYLVVGDSTFPVKITDGRVTYYQDTLVDESIRFREYKKPVVDNISITVESNSSLLVDQLNTIFRQ